MRKFFLALIFWLLFSGVGTSLDEVTLIVKPEKPHPEEEVTLQLLNASQEPLVEKAEVYNPDLKKVANIFLNDQGRVSFIPDKVGMYWVKIREREGRLNFTVKKEMWYSELKPENPRVGEDIRIGVPPGVGVKILDAEGNLYKTCKTEFSEIGGSSANFTIDEAGTYQIIMGELSQEWWYENITLVVREKRKLEITLEPKKAEIGKSIIIEITSENKSIENAKVIIIKPNGEVEEKLTSSSGKIIYPPPSPGNYLVQVEKEDYLMSEDNFTAYNSFVLEILPQEPSLGEEILLKVRRQDGKAVMNAKISLNGKTFTSNEEGEVSFSLSELKEYEISVEKEGFLTLKKRIKILLPLTLSLSSGEVELGEEINFKAFNEAGQELSEVDFSVLTPEGKRISLEGKSYAPSQPGRHEVYASLANYKTQNKSFEVAPYPLEIEKEFQRDKLIIYLSSHGEPAPGIKAMLSGPEGENSLITDQEGKAEIKVREGKFNLRVNPGQENKNYQEKFSEGYIKKEYSLWPFFIILLVLLATFLLTKSGEFPEKKAPEGKEEKKKGKTFIKKERKRSSLGNV